LGAAQLAVELGQRSGVKAWLEQAQHGLAVAANDPRAKGLRLVSPVEPPVLLQLPRQEAKRTRYHADIEEAEEVGKRAAHDRCQPALLPLDQRVKEWQHQFVRYGNYREVLDGVGLRLDEEVDVSAHQIGHEEPKSAEDSLPDQRATAFARAEAQPFVN